MSYCRNTRKRADAVIQRHYIEMPKPGDYYMAQVMREIDPDVQLVYSF